MPRRKAAIKREVLPDPLFGSTDVAKFINVIMRKGKKPIAEKIVYDALKMLTDRLKKEGKAERTDDDGGDSSGSGKKRSVVAKSKMHHQGAQEDSLEALQKCFSNIAPTVEVKSRRVGGATYQVPIEVAKDRGVALAMRWAVQAAKGRSEKTMAHRLAAELYEAYMGRGASIKIRDDVHRMAKANQAFAHYRW